MRKLFKKSLACAIALALCLTAFVGAISVNAETKNATITVENQEITQGTETVTVPVTITCADGVAINEAILSISSTIGTVTKIEMAEAGEAYVEPVTGIADKVFVSAHSEGYEVAKLNVTFAVAADKALGDYAIAIDVADVKAADYSESVVTLVYDGTGKVSVVAENTHTHDWEVVSATPAEGTDEFIEATGEYVQTKAGSINFECTGCDETKTEAVKWSWDYYIPFTAASCAAEISLQFSCIEDELTLNGDYSDLFVVALHVLSSNGSTKSTVIANAADTLVDFDGDSYACKTFSYGLKSTQLTENISAIPFICVDGVWYSGDTTVYSMREYVDSRLPMADCTDEEKAVLVNMLAYGSKMQQLKDYNLDNLADANLGTYEQFVITTDPTISGTPQEHPLDAGVYIAEYVLDMADKITVNWYFDSYYYEGENVDDYTLKLTWNNANGVPKEQIIDSTMYESIPDDDGNFNYYFMFAFAGLNSYDLRQDVTITIYDGETDISGEYVASVEKLISYGISSGTYNADEIAVFNAVMNYSDAARTFFCN